MIEMLKLPFMQTALIASILVGITCSFIGVYIVLKRVIFLGAAIANIATAGIAFGLILGFDSKISSIVFSLIGVICLSLFIKASDKRIPADSITGIIYAVSSAIAILLVAKSAQGEAHVLTLIFGDILSVNILQIKIMAIVFPVILIVHYLFYKEFTFVSFDPQTAKTLGLNTTFWELIIYITIGLTISLSIHTGGALLTFSFLVIPATAALLLTGRMVYVFLISIIFGVLSAFFGLYFSYVIDIPSGPTIIVTSVFIMIIALIIKKAADFAGNYKKR